MFRAQGLFCFVSVNPWFLFEDRASQLKRWVNWISLVLVFAVACSFLASWQFSRRESRLEQISLVKENFDKPPVDLSEVIANANFDLPANTWRKVKISGHYLPETQLLVRNRPNSGNAGFEQLVAFQTVQGTCIFVSRGWLPTGEHQDSPDSIPTPSEAPSEIVGYLLAAEPLLSRGAPSGQIASINPTLANKQTHLSQIITNGYLRLYKETPTASKELIRMPDPVTEEGNNLSYAIQWIIFAVMACAALVWRIRRDMRDETARIKSKRKSRADLDAEAEDSTITL